MFLDGDTHLLISRIFPPIDGSSAGTLVAVFGAIDQSGVLIVWNLLRRAIVLLPFLSVTLPSAASAQAGYPPPSYPYPAPAWRYAPPESNLRIIVKPKDASVYVDGYFAGKVDEFDGKFQRLHVPPGQHEIVVYLEGYRSLKQSLYLSVNATRTIQGELERLAPGEQGEPQPQPIEPPRASASDQPYPPTAPEPTRGPRAGAGPDEPFPPGAPGPPPPSYPRPRSEPASPSRYAALSIRVEPDAATLRIDGERWDGPSGDERLIVQVSEGRHTIEVEHDGFDRFTTDVDVRAGETRNINVSLRKR
jgi:hypothetical protein